MKNLGTGVSLLEQLISELIGRISWCLIESTEVTGIIIQF